MPTFKLFARFDLNDSEENYIHTFEESLDFDSMEEAENALESRISELISDFSQRSLNWVLLEKCITAEQADEEGSKPRNAEPGKSKSSQDFSALML